MKKFSNSTRLLWATIVGLALFISGSGSALAQTQSKNYTAARSERLVLNPRAMSIRSDIATKIEAVLRTQAIPSLTIVLFGPNEVLWAESFGLANIGTRSAASLETVYNTGSTFKIVLVSAIMQLVEQGTLSLDAPVNDYLNLKIDDFSNLGHPLTLRAMLAHRAGLPSSQPVPGIDIWSRQLPASDIELLSQLKAIELPGKRFDYCNICFAIYAEVIRNVTGTSLEDYLREKILLPAGVRYSDPFYPSAAAIEVTAFPYARVGHQPWPLGFKLLQAPYSGDAYMLPLDMVRLLQPFLNEGATKNFRLIQKETMKKMLLPVYPDSKITLGFLRSEEHGVQVLSWDGGVYGGSSVYQLEPGNQIGVYVASNSHQTTDLLHLISRRTRELLRSGKSETKITPHILMGSDPVTLPARELAALSGKYKIVDENKFIKIQPMGEQLSLTNPADKRFELVMTSDETGILVETRETIKFFRHDKRGVTSLRMNNNGYSFEARRIPSTDREVIRR